MMVQELMGPDLLALLVLQLPGLKVSQDLSGNRPAAMLHVPDSKRNMQSCLQADRGGSRETGCLAISFVP